MPMMILEPGYAVRPKAAWPVWGWRASSNPKVDINHVAAKALAIVAKDPTNLRCSHLGCALLTLKRGNHAGSMGTENAQMFGKIEVVQSKRVRAWRPMGPIYPSP